MPAKTTKQPDDVSNPYGYSKDPRRKRRGF
jgi:hypothetical protein